MKSDDAGNLKPRPPPRPETRQGESALKYFPQKYARFRRLIYNRQFSQISQQRQSPETELTRGLETKSESAGENQPETEWSLILETELMTAWER